MGVATDANGLYYMRARYYNVAVKRFINQDIVDGSIENSQSLNKFSYVQGNPIRLTDPFGLCPDISLTRIGHAALDLLGIIPELDVCDGINAVWYLIEGDYANAVTSAVAVLPMFGSLIGNGIKWGAKGVANAEKIADGIKAGSRIIGNAGALIQSGSQAVESAKNLYDSYVKDGEVISWKNATDLITLGLSVAGVGLAGKSLAKDGKALKAISQGNVNIKAAAVSNSTGSNTKTFYTVQNSADAKRLLGDGTPWPTAGNKANLGDGVYAWGNIDDANRYLTIKQGRTSEPLSVLKFEVYDSDLVNMRKFDTRVLKDDELNDFFDQYARLYGGTPNHGFDYIINDTNLGVEHYFNKTVFEKLHFLGKEGV